jgi:hypothetical protein
MRVGKLRPPSWVQPTSVPGPPMRGFQYPMRERRLVLLLVVVCAAVARAHSISNEVAVGMTQDTLGNPHGTNISDQLTARFDLSETLVLKMAGAFTYEESAAAPAGAYFATSSAQVASILVGAEWDVTPRINLYGEGVLSPRASQTFDSTLQYRTAAGTVTDDILLNNATSTIGVMMGLSAMVGGLEMEGVAFGGLLLDANVGWTAFSTEQKLGAIYSQRTEQPVSAATIRTLCKLATTTAQKLSCGVLQPALQGGEDTLNQFRISLGAIQPLGRNTDLGLSGAYYAYDQDPATIGFFTARATLLHLDTTLGAGMPLAPQRYTIRPQVEQRLGLVSLGLWYQFTEYASDEGYANGVGARVQVNLGRFWRVWLAGSLQFDELLEVGVSGQSGSDRNLAVTSGTVALGFRARF